MSDTAQPVTEACPLCGAPLGAKQEWCLRCGSAARTRLAATPRWRGPIVAMGVVIVASLGAITAALVSLAGDSGASPPAVTRTITTPAVGTPAPATPGAVAPGAATTGPTVTGAVPGTATTGTTPGTATPGAATTGAAGTATGAARTQTTVGTTHTSTTATNPTNTTGQAGTTSKPGNPVSNLLKAYERHSGKAAGTPAR